MSVERDGRKRHIRQWGTRNAFYLIRLGPVEVTRSYTISRDGANGNTVDRHVSARHGFPEASFRDVRVRRRGTAFGLPAGSASGTAGPTSTPQWPNKPARARSAATGARKNTHRSSSFRSSFRASTLLLRPPPRLRPRALAPVPSIRARCVRAPRPPAQRWLAQVARVMARKLSRPQAPTGSAHTPASACQPRRSSAARARSRMGEGERCRRS